MRIMSSLTCTNDDLVCLKKECKHLDMDALSCRRTSLNSCWSSPRMPIIEGGNIAAKGHVAVISIKPVQYGLRTDMKEMIVQYDL
jgi:hypothetical protein